MPYPEKYQNYKSFGPQDMSPFREAPQQPQAAPEPDMLSSEDRIRRLQQDVHGAMHSPPDPMLDEIPQHQLPEGMSEPVPNHIRVPDFKYGGDRLVPVKGKKSVAQAPKKNPTAPRTKPRYTLD